MRPAILLVVAALTACVSCELSSGLGLQQRHAKAPRAVRGFKNMALSTARGFGKRAGGPEWRPPLEDTPINPSANAPFEQGLPVAWLAEQMQSSPGLARLILRRFVDTDHDDRLSPQELLRVE